MTCQAKMLAAAPWRHRILDVLDPVPAVSLSELLDVSRADAQRSLEGRPGAVVGRQRVRIVAADPPRVEFVAGVPFVVPAWSSVASWLVVVTEMTCPACGSCGGPQ